MLTNTLYQQAQHLPSNFSVADLNRRAGEEAVLMCRPTHFCVASAINPHMVTETGELQVVDPELAMKQWQELFDVLTGLDLRVELIEPVPGLPDMVFTANQSFPFLSPTGERQVLLSRMRTEERRDEVRYFHDWYQDHGYRRIPLPFAAEESLEGMGDLLWMTGRRFLFAGIGPRTARSVVKRLPEVFSTPVLGLELVDPRFYHLDTALAILDEKTALIHPAAFSAKSLELLEATFERLLIPPENECESGFACNALCLATGHVIVDEQCPETAKMLLNHDYSVITVDTSEFRKSGGSVFCLTMMLPEAK